MFKKKTIADQIKACGHTIKPVSSQEFFETVFGLSERFLAIGEELGDDARLMNVPAAFMRGDLGTVALGVVSIGGAAADLVYELIGRLSNIPEETLRNDPAIGPVGLVEVVNAILEVNRVGSFFSTALPGLRNVWQGMKKEKSLTAEAERTS